MKTKIIQFSILAGKHYLAAVFFLLAVSILPAQNIPVDGSTGAVGKAVPYVPIAYNPNILVNLVRSTVPMVPAVTDASIQPTDMTQSRVSSQYLDGLGRPLQSVTHFASPLGNDMVNFNAYDGLGREGYHFLPYAIHESTVADNGKFKLLPSSDQTAFYQNTMGYSSEKYFYSQTNFEPSPLNREVLMLPPGNPWVGNNLGQSVLQNPSGQGETIQIWEIGSAAGSLPTTTAVYNTGELTEKTVTDEDGHAVEEYTDKKGKVVCKEIGFPYINKNNKELETYYVYDDYGLLRFVIPPKASAWLKLNSWTLNATIASDLCFSYEYDGRLRPILKNTPGAGTTSMVYNLKDQLLFSQNQEQKAKGEWTFVNYDVLGRNIQSGVYRSALTQAALQALVNQGTSNDVFLKYLLNPVYGNAAYKTTFSAASVYITNYYDDYSFTSRAFNSAYLNSLPTGWNNTPSTETNGLLTGTLVVVLNGTKNPPNLSTVNFYTDRGRLLQTQNQNINGDWNYTTNAYDFIGQLAGSVQEINNSKSVDHPKVTLLKTLSYDHQGRLLQIMHQWDNLPAVPIATYQYDELGRVKQKKLGNNAEALNNEYNIRNWLTGINRSYCLNASGGHFFGMELSYDYGYTTNYLNGNIAGMKWRNKGKEIELRSYGYNYDNFNRLTGGDFVYESGLSSWTTASKDYSVSNIFYDENGNLLSMKQMGLNAGGAKIVLDDLQYDYFPNSNKLQAVSEKPGSQSKSPTTYDGLGDFRDVAGTTDYTYDSNGNLTADANKSMTLTYDAFLNKQTRATKGSNSVQYIYDALGNKLQKKISAQSNSVVDYMGPVVYTNNGLDFIQHDEGRVKWASRDGYTYEYYIKDHLGNTRTVLSEKPAATPPGPPPAQAATLTPVTYLATSEMPRATVENQLFANIETTRAPKPYCVGANDVKSAKIGAGTNMIGPDITLKVMAGDSVEISAEALYTPDPSGANSQVVPGMVQAFVSAFSALPPVLPGEVGALSGSGADNTGIVNAILNMQQSNTDPNSPNAFLNYVLFDENMNLLPAGSGAIQINQANTTWQPIPVQKVSIPQNGFIRVFSSNTSTADVRIDNLYVIHYQGILQEEYNYYPYGLIFDQSHALTGTIVPTNYLYNGKELQQNEFGVGGNGLELYDYGARMYDVQIGRWTGIDPLADTYSSWTPYSYAAANPMLITDPNGMGLESVHIDDQGGILANYNDGDNSVYLHKDEKTAADVDKKYASTEGHSAGGEKVGELGGNIDANGFLGNLLSQNKEIATGMNMFSWANKVRGDAPWDLKDNKSTIFGVAWAFDLNALKTNPNARNTSFSFGENDFSSSADVGNYHAGYTGTYAGISYSSQWLGAGVFEQIKNKDAMGLINPWVHLLAPHGDASADYQWNTKGMTDAAWQMGKVSPATYIQNYVDKAVKLNYLMDNGHKE